MQDYEVKELKSYKGYGISKAWKVNFEGKRKGNAFYLVDDGDDYLGEEFTTLEQAKEFIDTL